MARQPDDGTCGPTCLYAIYRYYGEDVGLEEVIAEVPRLDDGGTLAVLLGCHALRRGYTARTYTCNLQVFDPTWFLPGVDLRARLEAQRRVKAHKRKLLVATGAYLEFLDRGGQVRLRDLTTGLIRRYLRRGFPILTGLSATYLYRSAREDPLTGAADDVRGVPTGHFVLLTGYDRARRQVRVADPLHPNPLSARHEYAISVDRVIGSILLGVLTYDANLLIIRPPHSWREYRRVSSDHRKQPGRLAP